jgi:hypothetical protein
MASMNTAAILRRLEDDGHLDVLNAVLARRISPFHAGCIVGYFRRRPAKSPPGTDPRSNRRLGVESMLLRGKR